MSGYDREADRELARLTGYYITEAAISSDQTKMTIKLNDSPDMVMHLEVGPDDDGQPVFRLAALSQGFRSTVIT